MKEKIGIISDTHGLLRPEVLEILKDCKYILHAGDVNKDEILDVLRAMGSGMGSGGYPGGDIRAQSQIF